LGRAAWGSVMESILVATGLRQGLRLIRGTGRAYQCGRRCGIGLKRPRYGLEEKKPPLEAGEGKLVSYAAARDAAAADIIAPSIRRHCRKFPNIWLFPPFELPQACSTAAGSKNKCAQIGARDAMGHGATPAGPDADMASGGNAVYVFALPQ
jgi:hypothetical protein